MKYIDYQEAIAAGADPQGLMSFVKANPDIELRNFNPDPQISAGDVVSPFKAPVEETQNFNPAHPAVDIAPTDPSQPVQMTNDIGGVPFTGIVTDPSGQYYQGFGNYYGVIGASPEELAQMSPEERVRMSTVANNIMSTNPDDTQANQQLAAAFPGKNVSLTAHLADPVVSDPMGVATGSATMTMGSTGHSTGVHAHKQFVNVNGEPLDFEELLNIVKSRTYR